jgi:hypothetical protein
VALVAWSRSLAPFPEEPRGDIVPAGPALQERQPLQAPGEQRVACAPQAVERGRIDVTRRPVAPAGLKKRPEVEEDDRMPRRRRLPRKAGGDRRQRQDVIQVVLENPRYERAIAAQVAEKRPRALRPGQVVAAAEPHELALEGLQPAIGECPAVVAAPDHAEVEVRRRQLEAHAVEGEAVEQAGRVEALAVKGDDQVEFRETAPDRLKHRPFLRHVLEEVLLDHEGVALEVPQAEQEDVDAGTAPQRGRLRVEEEPPAQVQLRQRRVPGDLGQGLQGDAVDLLQPHPAVGVIQRENDPAPPEGALFTLDRRPRQRGRPHRPQRVRSDGRCGDPPQLLHEPHPPAILPIRGTGPDSLKNRRGKRLGGPPLGVGVNGPPATTHGIN